MSQISTLLDSDLCPKLQNHAPVECCQAASFENGSASRVPCYVDYLGRTVEHFRRFGFVQTLRKVTRFLFPARTVGVAISASRKLPSVPLNLRPGELVEVKSLADINATLDSSGTLNGLTFLPAMSQYCGKRFTVLKRMERMFQEESGTARRVKNTVLLDRVMCDGLLMRCDRSCFFYWRESWLKRVQSDTQP